MSALVSHRNQTGKGWRLCHFPRNWNPAARTIAYRMRDRDGYAYTNSNWRLPFFGGYKFEHSSCVANSDGAIFYVYFGPKAPAGWENNWVQTIPGKGWFMIFETASAVERFKESEYSMNAAVKAAVAASGAALNAKYEQGVAVFTLPKSGAMVQVAAGGQKFKFEPIKR